MNLKNCRSNPHLPLAHVDEMIESDLGLQLPQNALHGRSLNNLALDGIPDDRSPSFYDYKQNNTLFPPEADYKSMTATCCTPIQAQQMYAENNMWPKYGQFRNIRSSSERLSKSFENPMTMSLPDDNLCYNNFNQCNKTQRKQFSDGHLSLSTPTSQKKLSYLKARKNYSLSLSAIKASVPIFSKSIASIPFQMYLDQAKFNPQFSKLHERRTKENLRNIFFKSNSDSTELETNDNNNPILRRKLYSRRRRSLIETILHGDSSSTENDLFLHRSLEEKRYSAPIICEGRRRSALSLDIVRPFNDIELKESFDKPLIMLSDNEMDIRSMQSKNKVKISIQNFRPALSPRPSKCLSPNPNFLSSSGLSLNAKLSPNPHPNLTPSSSFSINQSISPNPNFPNNFLPNPRFSPSTQNPPLSQPQSPRPARTRRLLPNPAISTSASNVSAENFTGDKCSKEAINKKRLRKPSLCNSTNDISNRKLKPPKANVAHKSLHNIYRQFSIETEESLSDHEGESENLFFEPPINMKRRNARIYNRRSSSLENLQSFQLQKLAKDHESCRSSINISHKSDLSKEKHTPSLRPNVCVGGSVPCIANDNLNFPKTPKTGNALLQLSPKQHVSKTPETATTTPSTKTNATTASKSTESSSEYDVRDRGRGNGSGIGANSNSRESYRDRRDRDRDRDPERSLSDREQRDQGSFNRSTSNTEGTPEDKVG